MTARPLEHVRLICPRCRRVDAASGALITRALRVPVTGALARPGALDAEAVIACEDATWCGARYPVIEGVAVVFAAREAVQLAANPLLDWSALAPDTQLALVAGQGPEAALGGLPARLARLSWCAFHDWLDEAWAPPQPTTPHGAALMRWLAELDEPGRARAAGGARLIAGAGLGREAWESAGAETLLLDAHLPSALALQRLLRRGALTLAAPVDAGGRWAAMTARAPAPLPGATAALCGDVLDPPLEAEAFGSVIASNLIDSVSAPFIALGQCHAMVAPGGLLTVSSPLCWREAITPREAWLTGAGRDDDAAALEALVSGGALTPPLTLRGRRALWWALRNTAREVILYRSEGRCFARAT